MTVKKYLVTVDEAGTARWYKDAKCTTLHRESGPAVEYTNDGTKFWYRNGKLHRTGGPAIVYKGGHKEWYRNGRLHRTDGPAIIDDCGGKYWYQNNQLHRTDGPAIEYACGNTYWYINGEELSEAEIHAATQPVVELSVADVEKLLGKRVKIVK